MDTAYKQQIMKRIDERVSRAMVEVGANWPDNAGADGIYNYRRSDWWTSGFYPGMLWILYDMTGNEEYKKYVWERDAELEQWLVKPTDQLHHDVGFQFLPTAVIKHTLTGDEDGLRRGLEAANFLAGRFNPVGEFIRAWNIGPGSKPVPGWAIIDCMMNIPLLFWASQVTGDPRYKHIATKHADTVLKYGVRQDGSTCHILSFDPESGAFIEPIGGQGYAPMSAWSRGNSWALHGFALAYRYTGEARYLEAAKRVAHYFIAALPEDRVPYWDFRLDSLDGEPRDSSAAAIAASGLLEIAEAVPGPEKGLYTNAAELMLKSLTDNYSLWDVPNAQGLLTGATGHKPAGGLIDCNIIYGDYYYVEAFAKLNGWKHRIF